VLCVCVCCVHVCVVCVLWVCLCCVWVCVVGGVCMCGLCVCMCECVIEIEILWPRENRERGRLREGIYKKERGWERERVYDKEKECVCVLCVCERERERERESMRVVCMCACVCLVGWNLIIIENSIKVLIGEKGKWLLPRNTGNKVT